MAVLTDEEFFENQREIRRYCVRHPIKGAREAIRKIKFLWRITGIRKPDQIRRTAGTRFFFWLRGLLQKIPGQNG